MNLLDNIGADRGEKDRGHGMGSSRRSTIAANDGDGRSAGHFENGCSEQERQTHDC